MIFTSLVDESMRLASMFTVLYLNDLAFPSRSANSINYVIVAFFLISNSNLYT